MIPELILNKISLYRWKNKVNKLNMEFYGSLADCSPCEHCNICTNLLSAI